MKVEIEKNYEAKGFPTQLLPFEEKTVWQSYVLSTEEEELRIRKQHYLGEFICDMSYKKIQSEGVRRTYELKITEDIYNEMVEGKAEIVKERKFYMVDGHQVMVDYFPQLNIYFAEVEFETEEEYNSYKKPDWLGNEVKVSNKELIKLLK